MKYLLLIATLVAGSAISAEAMANAQLAKSKNCMA